MIVCVFLIEICCLPEELTLSSRKHIRSITYLFENRDIDIRIRKDNNNKKHTSGNGCNEKNAKISGHSNLSLILVCWSSL